jgi:hypothetical protein
MLFFMTFKLLKSLNRHLIITILGMLSCARPASAQLDAAYTQNKTSAWIIGQKIQEQLGLNSGYSITELKGVSLISPRFEISAKIRLLSHFGTLISNTLFAQGASSSQSDNSFSIKGYDRPVIQARQLVYGNFHHGRWYILDLGINLFNIQGYTPELFRFWSGRVALHESIYHKWASPQLELGLAMRSRTENVQPSNLGLIYPPTFDLLLGASKQIKNKFIISTNVKLEQSINKVSVAGSYDSSLLRDFSAPTMVIGNIE